MDGLFKGRHFDQEIIVLCVRWYLRYKLSFRDLTEMMAERGLSLAHTTIMRWIQCYVPEFEKRWNRFARPAGRSWRVAETYVKIRGRWSYLYLSTKRETPSISCFAPSGMSRPPRRSSDGRSNAGANCHTRVTLDGYQASHRGSSRGSQRTSRGNQCEIGVRPNTSTI